MKDDAMLFPDHYGERIKQLEQRNPPLHEALNARLIYERLITSFIIAEAIFDEPPSKDLVMAVFKALMAESRGV
jgi:hypothetical protein